MGSVHNNVEQLSFDKRDSSAVTGEKGSYFLSFTYVWTPTAAVKFTPAGLYGY